MKFQGFVNNRSSQFTRDCTVRALTSVTGLDYRLVFETLKLYGRKDNKGFNIHGWLHEHRLECLGYSFIPVTGILPQGKFLCYNNGHAWAVIDGKLFDSSFGGRRAKYIYRVIKNPDGDHTEEKMKLAEKQARLFNED